RTDSRLFRHCQQSAATQSEPDTPSPWIATSLALLAMTLRLNRVTQHRTHPPSLRAEGATIQWVRGMPGPVNCHVATLLAMTIGGNGTAQLSTPRHGERSAAIQCAPETPWPQLGTAPSLWQSDGP